MHKDMYEGSNEKEDVDDSNKYRLLTYYLDKLSKNDDVIEHKNEVLKNIASKNEQ